MNKLIWLSSPLLGLFFVASYYANNLVLFLPIQVVPAIIGTIILCSLISLAAYLFSKNKLRANLISILVVAGIFTWGYSSVVSIVLLFGAMVLGFTQVKDKILVHSNRIALLLMVGLLVVPLFNIVVYHAGIKYKPINEVVSKSHSPDIYYIVLDSYTSDDVMASLGYDNSYFTDYLKEKGFVIREDAFCNYPRTYMSVPSTLTMDYLKNPEDMGENYHLIQTNRVFEQAHELGYKVINLSSNWCGTEKIKYADENYGLNYFQYDSFTSQVWRSMILGNINLMPLMPEIQRNYISYQLSMLSKFPGDVETQPRFIFAHILIPHHSFALFHSDGSDLRPSDDLTVNYVYFQHLEYINKEMVKVIDGIINHSKEKPIIILQSDEGISTDEFYSLVYTKEWINEPKLMKQRASILSAYYLPTEVDIPRSSVNTFRIVFNEYFGGDYEILDDVFYYPKVYVINGSGAPSKGLYDATDVIR